MYRYSWSFRHKLLTKDFSLPVSIKSEDLALPQMGDTEDWASFNQGVVHEQDTGIIPGLRNKAGKTLLQ
jgi:hypothetical protein